MAFPIVKMGNNPQNFPFSLPYVDPHLIQQCLGPSYTTQTAAPTVEALSHTPQSSHWLRWRASKVPIPVDRSPNTTILASSLQDPSELWCQTASGSDPPFFHNALDRPTHGRTYIPTDRPRESLITIGRCATRATRPRIIQ